jgi:hypothetical protein
MGAGHLDGGDPGRHPPAGDRRGVAAAGRRGLYWLVPGMAFCLVVAVVNAWVLLVEVVR